MNLKFFKGIEENLPNEDNREIGSFYLTEDTLDFYYASQKDLVKLASNPHETIKEIHSFYSTTTNRPPNNYPPSADWSSTPPEYEKGQQIYSVSCIVYMDEHYIYSNVNELITWDDIDTICGYNNN